MDIFVYTVVRAKRAENVMLYVEYVNLYCIHIYIPPSRPREAWRKNYIVRLVVCQFILSMHTNTPISSARSAEKNYIVLCVLYYFIYCVHITTPLLLRVERGEKMYCITY